MVINDNNGAFRPPLKRDGNSFIREGEVILNIIFEIRVSRISLIPSLWVLIRGVVPAHRK